MATFKMVEWMQSDGVELDTMVYASHVTPFCADVVSVGGRVLNIREVS